MTVFTATMTRMMAASSQSRPPPANQDRAAAAADDAAFYGPLCDMIAEYCANHGVDIRYPVHITDPDGEERIQEFVDPTDGVEREYWMKGIDEKIMQLKETQHELAEENEEAENG